MSAATRRTDGSSPSDFMTETAAGPPAPVTMTLTVRKGTFRALRYCMWRLPVTRDHADRLGDRVRRPTIGSSLTDHFERLGVSSVAKARPIAGCRLDEVRLQVGPDLGL